MHCRPSFLLCFWHNRKLQKYYERVKEEQFSHRVMLGEQGEIAIPTAEFNLIFQLTHIFSHLMNEGIGLRQLVDYYFVICDFYKVYQNFSNPSVSLSKGSSTFSPSPSSSGSGDVTAHFWRARNRYALRLSDRQRSRHILRDGTAWGEESFEFKVYSLQFIVYNLYSGDFVDLL